MSVYSKGASYERELLSLLKQNNYAAVRVAGSGRARMEQPDLIASNGAKILGFECKFSASNYKSISVEEVNLFFKFCKEFNCTPVLAFRFPNAPWKFKILTSYADSNINIKKTDEMLLIHEII